MMPKKFVLYGTGLFKYIYDNTSLNSIMAPNVFLLQQTDDKEPVLLPIEYREKTRKKQYLRYVAYILGGF